jgi:hypothetical protein
MPSVALAKEGEVLGKQGSADWEGSGGAPRYLNRASATGWPAGTFRAPVRKNQYARLCNRGWRRG